MQRAAAEARRAQKNGRARALKGGDAGVRRRQHRRGEQAAPAIQGDGSMHDAAALDRLKDLRPGAAGRDGGRPSRPRATRDSCTHLLDDGGSEGLVRMCACRGTAGVAHLSCLVKQAQLATEKDGSETESTDGEADRCRASSGTRAASASRSTTVC